MHPYWSPWNFTSYSTFLVLGCVAGFLLARARSAPHGIPHRHMENIVLLVVLVAMAGAMAIGKLAYEGRSFVDLLKVWEPGGRVYYGGFLGGVAAIAGYCAATRLPVLRVLDIVAAPTALGLALGRIGCFLGGCCWGDVCAAPAKISQALQRQPALQNAPFLSGEHFAFAVRFPADSFPYKQHVELGILSNGASQSLPVHPVQLYETVAALALCWYLDRRLVRDGAGSGRVFAASLVGYAVIRFTLEFLRADNPADFAGLTLAQATALALGLGGAMWLWRPQAAPVPRTR